MFLTFYKLLSEFVFLIVIIFFPVVERPNLGCRTLTYRNFSKILSGIKNDIGDWVVDTRVKSAALLYQLIINEEENTTQHLEQILHCLYKGSSDENNVVVNYVST